MDARSAAGAQAGTAWQGSCDELQVPPEEDAGGRSSTSVPLPVELQSQSQYQHQQQRQRLRQRHQQQHPNQQQLQDEAPSIPRPSPSLSSGTSRSTTVPDLYSRRTVEGLARKLSKQNLQRGCYGHGQLQMQPTPSLSSSTATAETTESRTFRSWAEHKVSSQSPQGSPFPSAAYTIPSTSYAAIEAGQPIEVDEDYIEKPDDRRLLDVRRPRRQPSGQLRGRSNTRLIDPRVEDLIASGTQCTVRSESSPAPAPTNTTSSFAAPFPPGFIEPDPECAMPTPDPDPDDMDEDLSSRDLLDAALDGTLPLRYASGPGGVRKYTVGGVALRYRLSVDVALRCQNVVRNRPRMRKRTKTRHGSNASSAVTSAVNSPVLSSASSPPLPPTNLSP